MKNTPVDNKQRKKDILILSYIFGGLALTIILGIINILYGIFAFIIFVIGMLIQVRINTVREDKGENEMNNDIEKLTSISYDYDGYDFIADADKTDPYIYEKITNIITNNKLDVKNIAIYNDLSIGCNQEDFDVFYDEWIEYLKEQNYICYLDCSITIQEFTSNINAILKLKYNNYNIDIEKSEKIYYEELEKRKVYSKINYDLLIANVIASLLRENKLELIALDNNYFTIIKPEEISILKEIESKI